jgi:plasmid stabilization system protein ParE
VAYRVGWTESAWHELEAAAQYIARDSSYFASALIHEAWLAAQSLRKSPHRGRIVPELRDTSVREIFVKQYRLIYEVGSERVIILSFLHGARQFPETI